MAKSFLKKNPGKGAMDIVQKSMIRSAGTVGAAYVANNLLSRLTFIKPSLRGVAMFAIGVAGEVAVDNETIRTLAEGVTSYGALQSTGDLLLKTNKAQIGLAGLAGERIEEGQYEDVTPRRVAAPLTDFNWSRALVGAEELDGIGADDLSGAEDLDGIDGLEGLEGLEGPEEEMSGIQESMM